MTIAKFYSPAALMKTGREKKKEEKTYLFNIQTDKTELSKSSIKHNNVTPFHG